MNDSEQYTQALTEIMRFVNAWMLLIDFLAFVLLLFSHIIR